MQDFTGVKERGLAMQRTAYRATRLGNSQFGGVVEAVQAFRDPDDIERRRKDCANFESMASFNKVPPLEDLTLAAASVELKRPRNRPALTFGDTTGSRMNTHLAR
jgi:hypothetical protein